jgi:hypothetical protein
MLICWRRYFLKLRTVFPKNCFVCALVLPTVTLKSVWIYTTWSFISTNNTDSCHKPQNDNVNTYSHCNLKTFIMIVLANDSYQLMQSFAVLHFVTSCDYGAVHLGSPGFWTPFIVQFSKWKLNLFSLVWERLERHVRKWVRRETCSQ